MEERIIKDLKNNNITYTYWDQYYNYCYKTENIDLINAVINANVITLSDNCKNQVILKKMLLEERLNRLNNIKPKEK